ncbi:MAG: transporter substrate-binding protein [Glaciihabitans sp.]|nr:transporter substrate-binding protein [Glaciihabitans sp.]
MRSRLSRTLPVIAAAATALVILSGCSSTPAAEETTGSDELLGSVDTMFGQVDVPAVDGDLKVVALGWSDAEMALSLGVVPIAVLDWQGFGAESKGVGPWASDLFGDVTPEILERDDAQALNYEAIEVLDPDLILNTRSSNDEAEFERLSQIAPTVYAPADTGSFATSWDVQLESVSAALGLSDEGDAEIADINAQIADAAAAHPEFKGLTTAAAVKFADAYGSYISGDGRFDILSDLGFVNNPALDALEAAGFYIAVSAENIAAIDADVPVILPIGYTVDEVKADPLISSLAAAQQDRVVYIDTDSELSGAYSAGSPLAIPIVLDQLVPMLATAAANLG